MRGFGGEAKPMLIVAQVPEFNWHIIEGNIPFEIKDTGIWITPFLGEKCPAGESIIDTIVRSTTRKTIYQRYHFNVFTISVRDAACNSSSFWSIVPKGYRAFDAQIQTLLVLWLHDPAFDRLHVRRLLYTRRCMVNYRIWTAKIGASSRLFEASVAYVPHGCPRGCCYHPKT